MKVFNYKIIQDFTHNLIFPAVLGSMIFEILNIAPKYGERVPVFYYFQIGIVCFYIVDYIFVHKDFIIDNRFLPKKWLYAIDILIVFLYRVAFSIVGRESFSEVLGLLTIILLLIFIYSRQIYQHSWYLLSIALLGIIFTSVSFIIYKGHPNIINLYFFACLFVLYFIYVFFYHDKFVKLKQLDG